VNLECLPGLKRTTANLRSVQFNVFARLEVYYVRRQRAGMHAFQPLYPTPQSGYPHLLFNRTASYSIGPVSRRPPEPSMPSLLPGALRARRPRPPLSVVGSGLADRSAPVPLAGLVSWCSFLGVTNLSYWTGAAGEPTERAAAAALCTD
jgi:hypothetical protein